jgi:hypothetical protein
VKYRWKRRGEDGWDESYLLYLILDGKKYEFADITWQPDLARWAVFVSGYASEETVHVERDEYELLCDAKRDVLDYMKVWFVSGSFQRMNAAEKDSWLGYGL